MWLILKERGEDLEQEKHNCIWLSLPKLIGNTIDPKVMHYVLEPYGMEKSRLHKTTL